MDRKLKGIGNYVLI